MAIIQQLAVNDEDPAWNELEVQMLALAARDTTAPFPFTAEGVDRMVDVFNAAGTKYEGAARETLQDILLKEAEVDPSRLKLGPSPVALRCQDGTSNKFYKLEVQGTELHIHHGRIGSTGKRDVKNFATVDAAIAEFNKKLKEKTRGGYVLDGPAAPQAQASSSEVSAGAAGTTATNAAIDSGATEPSAPVTPPPALGWTAASSSPEALLEAVRDLAGWKELPQELRDEVLLEDYDGPLPAGFSTPSADEPEAFDTPAQREFAEKLKAELNSEIDVDDPGDEYPTVGEPEWELELLVLPSGEVAGGKVRVKRAGASQEDDEVEYESHFDSEEEAREAGFDPDADIQWSAKATYDSELELVSDSPYWEWDGH